MSQAPETTIDRQAGADTLAARAVAIGLENAVEITQCVWDFGTDLTHTHAHRLDIFAAERTVRLYFTELELTTLGNAGRTRRTEERLRGAIVQMAPRVPAPTYNYK